MGGQTSSVPEKCWSVWDRLPWVFLKIASGGDSLAKSLKSPESCFDSQNNKQRVHIDNGIRFDEPNGSSLGRGWMGHRRPRDPEGQMQEEPTL